MLNLNRIYAGETLCIPGGGGMPAQPSNRNRGNPYSQFSLSLSNRSRNPFSPSLCNHSRSRFSPYSPSLSNRSRSRFNPVRSSRLCRRSAALSRAQAVSGRQIVQASHSWAGLRTSLT